MKRNRCAARLEALATAVLVLLFALAGGCGKLPSRYEGSFLDVFDTVTKVVIYAGSEAEAQERFDEVHAVLAEYHKLCDIYNEYDDLNNAATVNRNAGVAPVEVDGKLIALIEYAKELYSITQGRMNIAMGSVLSIWHEYREAGIEDPLSAALPPQDELEEAARHTDINAVVTDAEAGTLFLADAEMSIDLGAVAKGYAAQRAINAMREAGVTSMLLSVGGNVCAIGTRADGKSWKVQVEAPYGGDAPATVDVDGLCLVTSGNYQRYYEVDGVRYHHIIDPATLMPARYFSSVTVLAADSGLADALSTALFILPLEEGRALAHSIGGIEVCWIDCEGNMTVTDGFENK